MTCVQPGAECPQDEAEEVEAYFQRLLEDKDAENERYREALERVLDGWPDQAWDRAYDEAVLLGLRDDPERRAALDGDNR